MASLISQFCELDANLVAHETWSVVCHVGHYTGSSLIQTSFGPSSTSVKWGATVLGIFYQWEIFEISKLKGPHALYSPGNYNS
jgi:hypothetical protein